MTGAVGLRRRTSCAVLGCRFVRCPCLWLGRWPRYISHHSLRSDLARVDASPHVNRTTSLPFSKQTCLRKALLTSLSLSRVWAAYAARCADSAFHNTITRDSPHGPTRGQARVRGLLGLVGAQLRDANLECMCSGQGA